MREEDAHLERQGLYSSEGGRQLTWKGRDSMAVREEGTHLKGQGFYSSEGGRHSPGKAGASSLLALLHTLMW